MDKSLAQRLRDHVTSRLPGSEPVIKNGAWQMMLDAADEIERLQNLLQEDNEQKRRAYAPDLTRTSGVA